MSASNVNNATTPRQVTCETSDGDQVPVDIDVLLISGTFKQMYDDLGLEEHNEFPGVFPVTNVSSPIFKRVVEWCTEHKGEPEPVIEKDPLTHECKWFDLTDYDKALFNVPMPELLELIIAASYLNIPRLYHYACQSVAGRIKGKQPRDIGEELQQDCDLDDARSEEIYFGNPWLSTLFLEARVKDRIDIPSEVLINIFEKLPREDLERLQFVSAQFDDVIASSSELSESQGPRRVVAELVIRPSSFGSRLRLRDGTEVTCPDYEYLAKHLSCSIVQKMSIGLGGVRKEDVERLSALLPAKSTWKDATIHALTDCFSNTAPVDFLFTELLLCKKIVLTLHFSGEARPITWAPEYMRLPALVACNQLDLYFLSDNVQVASVVEWLELPPEQRWVEPKQLVLRTRFVENYLNELKKAFEASSSPKPYVVRLHSLIPYNLVDHELKNEERDAHHSPSAEPGSHRDTRLTIRSSVILCLFGLLGNKIPDRLNKALLRATCTS